MITLNGSLEMRIAKLFVNRTWISIVLVQIWIGRISIHIR